MKKKTNIYDSDDADRSKRLSFTPEERAARAQQKAEILGQKLERAEKKIPKKKKVRLQKELDPEKSRMKHTLRFEEVEKQRGKEALPKKASRRMWKDDRFFTSKHKELTKPMAAALLKNGRIKMKGLFSEKKGVLYDAVVVLADTGDKYVNYKIELPPRQNKNGKE